MAFATDTLARAAFKKMQGLAHTGATKDLANESEASGVQIATSEIYANIINASPLQAISDGVAAFVSLDLSLDISSNGKSYAAVVGTVAGTGLEGKTNPKTGEVFQDGDRVGDLISTKYGEQYRAILYSDDVEVPPLSSEDWFLDYKSGIVTSEDNLNLSNGTIDGYVYIGQYLSQVDFSSSAIYPYASGDFDPWVTIYVSVDGYDTTGDGSIENPYRQPQRALQDIILPNGGGAYVIQCGPGEFEAPVFEAYVAPAAPDSLYINIVGDRSTILADVTANTFALDSGKYASWNTSVTGFSSADPYSYWICGELSFLPGWAYGEPVLASSSGNLKTSRDLTGYYDGYMAVHPFATTFVFGESPGGITGNTIKTPINSTIGFTGINFVGGTFTTVQNVYLQGCTISSSSTIFLDEVYYLSTGTAPSLVATSLSRNALTGYFSGSIQLEQYSLENFSHNVAGGQHLNLFNNFCYLTDVDFTGTTTKIRAYGSTIQQVGSISVAGTGRWLELNQQSFFEANGTGTITGSVNGVPIDVNDGSHITGIKAAADGTLTNSVTPGAEINVGGLSSLAFSDLPKTDFGLGDLSQGCRAT